MRDRLMVALRGHFRPELLNRIDEILIFEPLSREALREIVKLEVAKVERRLASKEITLQVDEAALDVLAQEGYDPVFGARPLRRLIERRVQNPLAGGLLAGEFHAGDTVRVRVDDAREGTLRLERLAGACAA